MSTLLTNQYTILWATESSYGSDAVESILTDEDADIIHQDVRSLEITKEGVQAGGQRARASHSGNKHAFIKGRCAVSGEIPLTPYISSSEQVPYNDAILQAMNLQPDLGTSDEATYEPVTENQDSATIYKYYREAENSDYRLDVVTGVRLTGTFNFEVGSEPYISFEGGGNYTTLTDPAAFIASDGTISLLKDGSTSVTARNAGTEEVADQAPLTCVAMTISIGGTDYTVQSLELDLGWDVSQKEAVTGDEQTVKHILTRGNANDARIQGSYTLSDYTAAVLNEHLDRYEDDSEVTLSIVMDNGTDQVTLSSDKMQLGIPGMSDNGGTMNLDVPFFLNGDWSTSVGGDNDFSILYDAV
jgi:hypothetical protein